jgi:hypothetical protein
MNVGIGYAALKYLIGGTANIAIGDGAMSSADISGSCNTAVGQSALRGITSGSNNSGLGVTAGCNVEHNLETASNHVALGNNNSTELRATIGLTVVSDARDKTDVADLDLGLDYIKALRPVYYRWDKRGWYDDSATPHGTEDELNTYLNYEPDGTHKRNRWEIGLLAQEVLVAEKAHTSNTQVLNEGMDIVANEGVTVEGTSDTGYRLQYQKITMPLIKAIQELDAENTALKARVTTLEG